MEPAAATSFPVAGDPSPRPAPRTAHLGQSPARRGWVRWVVLAIVSLGLTASFALALYQVRDSPRDFGFVVATYYFVALLCCCLAKLNHLPHDGPAAAPVRWRVRLAVWGISVALAYGIANRAADAMPDLGLQIAVWVITGAGIGVGFYFLFLRPDVGCRTDSVPHEVSPEQRV